MSRIRVCRYCKETVEHAKNLRTELISLRVILTKLHAKHCAAEPVPAVQAALALADLAIARTMNEPREKISGQLDEAARAGKVGAV